MGVRAKTHHLLILLIFWTDPAARWLGESVATTLDVDYLVVGAGAMGMAFVDALVAHSGARVALVDRRHSPGGHWLDAYPFVRLHQASAFYGVASTLLGGNRIQQDGPEAGLHERASAPEICAYYEQVLAGLVATGRVEWLPCTDHVGGGRVVSRVSGRAWEVAERCRVVDARFLAPDIPKLTPPPFTVEPGVRVVPPNDLVALEAGASEYVVVGSGKTATDACIWLLARGVSPDAIAWVRPRDPWMFNRAVLQPEPAVFLGMVATVMESASQSADVGELFRRLEDAGVMLRIDPEVEPTMARAPTLGEWELAELRTIERVVRLGHVTAVSPGLLTLEGGTVAVARDAVVVHCAAHGLQMPAAVPIWGSDAITLQPIRAGFPCFGAALAGYVEATRPGRDADGVKNRLCPPTPYGNSRAQWARMNLLGSRAVAASNAEPDVRDWANTVRLNPARVLPEQLTPELKAVLARLQEHTGPGLAGLEALSRD